jgi:dipeptidase E
LDLIPFQINPHYTDFVQKGHAGETREMRIKEFLMANPDIYVAGLREGTMLSLEDNHLTLRGNNSCRIFKYAEEAIEISSGGDINFLMQT